MGTINGELGSFFAIDITDGSILWEFPHEVPGTPAVANGVVYVGSSDKSFYALDALTGVVRWSAATDAGVYSSPAVANGVVYVGDDLVHAYRVTDGELLWSYSTSGLFSRSPAVVDGSLYTCSFDGNLYAFSLPG